MPVHIQYEERTGCNLKIKEVIEKIWRAIFAPQQAALDAQKQAFHPVLKIQSLLCALLLACVALCRAVYPMGYEALKLQYQNLLEEADYTASLVRFAQQAAEAFSVQAQATELPVGSTLIAYQPSGGMVQPVQNYYVSSGYGWREDPLGDGWSFHNGVDFACAEGEAVYAAMDGVVEQNYWSDSYGNCICIRHADGSVTRYAHLQYAFARVGEVVCAGAQVGTAGQTGATTGAHLHFEVLVNNERQDPTAALGL